MIRRAVASVPVLVAAVAVTLGAPVAPAPPAAAVSPDLVVSQVYGGGGNAGAPFNADFVELFNRGTAPASLSGMSIQYASATGTGNLGANAGQLTELPDVVLAPGQAYLVQQAGGATGAPLPAPDLVDPTPIAMAAGAGKVALVRSATSVGCNGGSTPCTEEQLALIVDLVGYGGANFFEGTAAAPTLTNTTAALRVSGGCQDTDQNGADFVSGAPAPRSSTSPVAPCGGPPANTPPSVTPNPFPISHPGGTTASYGIQAVDDGSVADVTVDTDPLPAGVTIDVGTAGSPRSITVTVDATAASGASPIALTLTDDEGATTALTVALTVSAPGDECGAPVTHSIMDVQGSGVASPLVGQSVRVEGIVTASYQASGLVGGFYLQDPEGDDDPTTSDGILVFASTPVVEPGERVRLTGQVIEFERAANAGQGTVTELGAPLADIVVCGEGLGDLVKPTMVELPFAEDDVAGTPYEERFEGMRVTFPQQLTVTENFTLGRFGEVVLTFGPPLVIPTNATSAGTPEEIDAANDRNRVMLDDGRSPQNLFPIAYQVGGDPTGVPRIGDMLDPGDQVEGIFTFDFGVYRVQPVGNFVGFVTGDPRDPAPDAVGGDVTVASFNVLNYFTTLNNAAWAGAPDTPRGATTAAELERQQTKIVEGIIGLEADIVGLIEIENNGPSTDPRIGPDAVATLVAAVNAALPAGATPYAAIDAPDLTPPNFLGGTFGTDAIKVALIYRPDVVTPAGAALADSALVNPADPAFPAFSLFDRPPLVQTFALAGGEGEELTVVLNHFKSKGSLSPNCDPAGGGLQGNCNDLRARQSQGLLDIVAAEDLEGVAIVGDLNAYPLEDPIQVLVGGGFVSPIAERLEPADRYSFTFQGERGELDHVLVDDALAPLVTGADIWHINSPEPPAKDYTSFNNIALYEPNAFRSSDHDPALVGLDLTPAPAGPVITAPDEVAAVHHERTVVPVSAVDADAAVTDLSLSVSPPTAAVRLRETEASADAGDPLEADVIVGPLAAVGSYTLTLTAETADGRTATTTVALEVGPNQPPAATCPAEATAEPGDRITLSAVDPDSPVRLAVVREVAPRALLVVLPAAFPDAEAGEAIETELVVHRLIRAGTYDVTVRFTSLTAVGPQSTDCTIRLTVQ